MKKTKKDIKFETRKKPPIYDRCVEKFGVDWDDGVIFTYGDTIYCKFELSPNKIAHESVHVKQQGSDPAGWWDKYFVDPDFRLSQEIEAYLAEKSVLSKLKDRNLRFTITHQNAKALSSEMYGNIISYSEALKLLL